MRHFLACTIGLWRATHETTNDLRYDYTVYGIVHHRSLEGAERRRKVANV
jgi:hypothetical protein